MPLSVCWRISKAGAAYVPIDVAYPQERKDYLIQDSQVSILLTNSSERESTEKWACERVYFDELDAEDASLLYLDSYCLSRCQATCEL